ncbi:MAG: hypothetical protein HQ567_01700 [Candidatus Nealsonbacteria bacterium]|nr:hypothetical protein [Candidatus Nealsonbacteria bacterium]
MSIPKLTDEQRQAVSGHPGGFTRVEDDQTQKVYFIIEESRATELYQRWVHEQLQVGFDEADRGQLGEWDLEAFLAKMHTQHAERTTQTP